MIFFNQVYAHFFTAFGHCEPSKVGWCFGLINFSLALAFFFALWTDVLSCSLKCVCQIERLISNVRRQVCRMISKKKKKNAGKSIVRWNQSTFLCVAMFCLFIFGQPLNRWLDWTYCDSLLQCCSHYSYRIQKNSRAVSDHDLCPPFFLCVMQCDPGQVLWHYQHLRRVFAWRDDGRSRDEHLQRVSTHFCRSDELTKTKQKIIFTP